MSDYGTVTEPGTIRFERLLSAPPETVWAFLVDPEKRAKWLAGGTTDDTVGGMIELAFNNTKFCTPDDPTPEKYEKYGDESRMLGRITQYDPPRLLSYTWIEPDHGIKDEDQSEATFELIAKGDKTLLILTHRRLREGEIMVGVAAGWHTHLGILTDHLTGKQPKSFWKVHMPLEDSYRKQFG